MAGKRSVTINDIARLANVSKATVSRVLNHKPDVDLETRERVLRIVEEQGFVPSIVASDLAGGRSRLVGVLAPPFTWPMLPDVMRGVAEAVAETPFELVLYTINDSMRDMDRSRLIEHILASKLTSGLLAIFPGPVAQHLTRLYKQRFPLVMIDDQTVPTDIPWIRSDNVGGAYVGVQHLIQLGHRRIAHIQGPMSYLVSRERHEGYRQALQEAGLTLDPDLVLEGDFQMTGGRAAAEKLFALPPEKRPTAIFASSDLTAYGVLAAAEEYNIQVPGDIALVGFDDLPLSPYIHPPLTTVRQDFAGMGRRGFELLLSMIESPPPSFREEGNFPAAQASGAMQHPATEGKPVLLSLPTRLVVRVSSGAPPAESETPDTSPLTLHKG
jgi:LacI family transcriptional regulator